MNFDQLASVAGNDLECVGDPLPIATCKGAGYARLLRKRPKPRDGIPTQN